MDKNTKELIAKIAYDAQKGHSVFRAGWRGAKEGWKEQLRHNSAAQDAASKAEDAADAKGNKAHAAAHEIFGTSESNAYKAYDDYWKNKKKKDTEKKSSMRNIIDDIIKGAEQNTFGRPVSVQVSSDFTPLDVAKFAGALQYLGEQGYSVKEAAEYLGLTEAQIQGIVSTVG